MLSWCPVACVLLLLVLTIPTCLYILTHAELGREAAFRISPQPVWICQCFPHTFVESTNRGTGKKTLLVPHITFPGNQPFSLVSSPLTEGSLGSAWCSCGVFGQTLMVNEM